MRGSSPRMTIFMQRKTFLLTTFLYVCISPPSAPEGGGHPEDLFMLNVEQLPSVPGSPRHLGRYGWRWERCRASAFCPPAGGRQTHSVNPSKLTEVGTSPTLRSRHLGGPASHLSFNPRRSAGGRNLYDVP